MRRDVEMASSEGIFTDGLEWRGLDDKDADVLQRSQRARMLAHGQFPYHLKF